MVVLGKVVHEVFAGGTDWIVRRYEAHHAGKFVDVVPCRVTQHWMFKKSLGNITVTSIEDV